MSTLGNDSAYMNAPSDTTLSGPWIAISSVEDIAFLVKVLGTGNPTATWSVEVTDDDDPTRPAFGPVVLTATAEMTAANPAGAGVAISAIFPFFNLYGGCPRAKWLRLIYTRTGGGSATVGALKAQVNRRGTL